MTFSVRQSTLRAFQSCPRRTWHDLQSPDLTDGFTEGAADLGTVVHAIAAEILETLKRQGQTQIPTQEAVEIAYEVYAASPVVLPPEDARDLVWLTLRVAERTWSGILMGTEIPLASDVPGPDGEIRRVTGHPDAVFTTQDARSLVVVDFKSGRGKPKSPRQPQEGVPEGVARGSEYLSDLYQGDVYSLLAMDEWPAAERVAFREYHVRSGLIREMVMGREELEHVRRLLGVHLMKLDRALQAGEDAPEWRPRPGAWCGKACAVSKSCPIPVERRGRGAIDSDEAYDEAAGTLMVVDAQRDALREALKARFMVDGRGARIGDGSEIRWDQGKGGAFGIVDEGWMREDVEA